jgi:replicative DNA helicase
MKELEYYDDQVLSLIINYPYFLDKTIIKDEYLEPKARTMFKILKKQYSEYKEFIVDKLIKNRNFDIYYFTKLLNENYFSSSREIKFNEFEKYLIDRYKKQQYEKAVREYEGNPQKLYKKLTELNEINYNENEYITAKDIYDTIESKNETINIGYSLLDKGLNLSKHDLVILAGGTGTGKTAFALNLLMKLSKNYQCIYFNQEMGKNILYRRILSMTTGIDIRKLREMNLTTEEYNKVSYALDEIERRKIILINKAVTITEIERGISNIKANKHIIVFVDHIGLIKAPGKSLYERMTETAKELRRISINYDCTIIGLCQLSRGQQKENRTPTIQDLRDSGEIEQSARKVLLIFNEKPNENKIQDIQIIIGKNDDGDKLIKKFKFDKYKQLFEEVYNG